MAQPAAVPISEQGPVRGASLIVGQRNTRVNLMHGRIVTFFKLLLPTLAIALIVLVIGWPLLQQQEGRFIINLTRAEREDARNLQVSNARYASVEKGGQPFSVTADKVRQDGPDAAIVHLENPKADILLSGDSWGAVIAENGIFNREEQVLELVDGVTFFHDLGYEFRTNSATLDLIGGNAFGFEPLEGQGPFGQLKAEGFRVYNRGDRIQFNGHVRLVFTPQTNGNGS